MKKDLKIPTTQPAEYLEKLSKEELQRLLQVTQGDDFKSLLSVLEPQILVILEEIARRQPTGCEGNFSDKDNIQLGVKRGQIDFIKHLRTLERGIITTLEVKSTLTSKE